MNVMAQLRPGIIPILKCIELHKYACGAEHDFDVATDADRSRDKFDDWSQDVVHYCLLN